jgi:hypothetical protein
MEKGLIWDNEEILMGAIIFGNRKDKVLYGKFTYGP